MMRLVGIIFAKESIDNLRDRRSIASALVMPLLGPLMVSVLLGVIASTEGRGHPVNVAVVGRANAPNLIAFLEREGAHVSDAPADYEAQVRKGDLDVALVVPETFARDFTAGKPAEVKLVEDGSSTRARATVDRTKRLLRAYSGQIGALRLVARGVSPELADAVSIDVVDLSTRQQHAAALLQIVPMFLLLAAFMGGLYLTIDAMAGERERGSLEPLLVNPVPRAAVVVGKWLAAVVAASAGVALMLAGMTEAIAHAPLEELGLRVSFGRSELLRTAFVLAPLVLFSSALQLLVSTFARTVKEAQTYLSLLTFAPTLPGMFLAMEAIQPAAWMRWVPGLGQQLLLTDVLRGDRVDALPMVGAAVSAALLAAVCLVACARMLGRERVIFGR